MTTKLEIFTKQYLKSNIPNLQAGDNVKVYQKIKEQGKERIQIFEGVLLAKKHGKGVSGTITVRKISQGVGVERVFPLHSPLVEKIEVARKTKVRQAKLYYLRSLKGKKARLKARAFNLELIEPEGSSEPERPAQEQKEPAQPATTSSDVGG